MTATLNKGYGDPTLPKRSACTVVCPCSSGYLTNRTHTFPRRLHTRIVLDGSVKDASHARKSKPAKFKVNVVKASSRPCLPNVTGSWCIGGAVRDVLTSHVHSRGAFGKINICYCNRVSKDMPNFTLNRCTDSRTSSVGDVVGTTGQRSLMRMLYIP